MKYLLISLLACFLSAQAMACIGVGRVNICRGDTVFPDSWGHDRGARVIRANSRYNTLKVRSNRSGDEFDIHFTNVSVTNLCSIDHCSGDLVYPYNWNHTRGARILAINPSTYKIMVVSNRSGDVFSMYNDDLYKSRGCISRFCVGNTVHPREWSHNRGGRVIGVKRSQAKLLVVSNSSGNVFEFYSNELRRGSGRRPRDPRRPPRRGGRRPGNGRGRGGN